MSKWAKCQWLTWVCKNRFQIRSVSTSQFSKKFSQRKIYSCWHAMKYHGSFVLQSGVHPENFGQNLLSKHFLPVKGIWTAVFGPLICSLAQDHTFQIILFQKYFWNNIIPKIFHDWKTEKCDENFSFFFLHWHLAHLDIDTWTETRKMFWIVAGTYLLLLGWTPDCRTKDPWHFMACQDA